MTLTIVNRVAGVFVILLSLTVVIPLTILTIKSGGGPWGFGAVGLGILLPLCAYVLFGFAGLPNDDLLQLRVFVVAHVVTITLGIGGMFVFPVYPIALALIPVTLAGIGILSKKHYRQNLLIMLSLAMIANVLLLKWELDFGRALPFLQLFQ